MSAKGSVHKVCLCRGPDGNRLGKSCPKLRYGRHGSWEYIVEMPAGPDGRRRQRHRGGFGTQDEARAKANALLKALESNVAVDDKLTTGEWLEDWLTGRKTIRDTTRRSYRSHLDLYLIPYLGRVRLVKLRAKHIRAMYDAIRDGNDQRKANGRQPVGPATIARVHATLRAALNAAVKEDLIPVNPALRVELTPARRPAVRPWEADDLGRFLDAAVAHRLGACFELMALTGLRRGEALGLRWSDVDLDRGQLVVAQQLINVGSELRFGPPKTRAGELRRVDLDAGTVGTLLAHRLRQDTERAEWGDGYDDHDLVFAREDGTPLRPEYVSRLMHTIAADLGLPPRRLHDLRHGSASLQLAAGVPIEIVSKRLGHSSITLTLDTYSHLLDGVGRKAAEATAAMVPRTPRNTTTDTGATNP